MADHSAERLRKAVEVRNGVPIVPNANGGYNAATWQNGVVGWELAAARRWCEALVAGFDVGAGDSPLPN